MSDCEQCKSFYLELERLRRLVPNGTYTLNVAHEEEIQQLKDAGEVLIRSLERMTKERDEARATVGLIAKLQVAHGCDCDEMCANFDCERCFACKVSDALEESAVPCAPNRSRS